MPTWRCLWRVLRRVVTWNGRVRFDMAPGCAEHFDPEFLWYTLRYRATQRPVIDEALRGFRGELVTLRTPVEVERYLRSYGAAAGKPAAALVVRAQRYALALGRRRPPPPARRRGRRGGAPFPRELTV